MSCWMEKQQAICYHLVKILILMILMTLNLQSYFLRTNTIEKKILNFIIDNLEVEVFQSHPDSSYIDWSNPNFFIRK